MKNKLKKSIIVILSIFMITTSMPMAAFAANETQYLSIVNDKKYDISSDSKISYNVDNDTKEELLEIQNSKKSVDFKNYSDVINYMQTKAALREKEVTFGFYNTNDVGLAQMYNDMVSEKYASKPTYGDYLLWSISNLSASSTINTSNRYSVITFEFEYYDNKTEEEKANVATQNALYNLNISNSSDYDKLWSIYNCIADNAVYVSDSEYSLTNHSAYSAICLGKTVCQGYATQLYRMLKAVGINNRIIVSEDHAWNIVEIDDKYYNVDLTWDDSTRRNYTYNYFLKNESSFDSEHPRMEEYNTTEFKNNYPISSSNYDYLNNIATYVKTNKILSADYTGSAINKEIEFDADKVSKSDYALTSFNNVESGTASIKVSGLNNYYDYVIRNFDIVDKSSNIVSCNHELSTTVTPATLTKNGNVITKCKKCNEILSSKTIYAPKTYKLSTTTYTYNGNVKKPSVVIKDSKGNTISNSNYTVKYASGRKYVGKYAVKITFKGNYSGTKSLYFTIKPKTTKITSLTAGNNSFNVKYSKITSQSTGYQVQYSTNSNFKNATTKTISSNKTTSLKKTKLKDKKKYYVRVRTYKTVNGVKYYSSWSTIKSIKTK